MKDHTPLREPNKLKFSMALIEAGFTANAVSSFIRAIDSHDELLEFAKKHHQYCEECEGTGKIYKHNDPTTGQWCPCPIAELLEKAKGESK